MVQRVARMGAGAGALLAVVLTLSLGVANPAVADAGLVFGTAADVGETLAAPAEELEAVTPVCVAGPIGAAVCTAAFVGVAAYATRDLWWPVASGAFSDAFSSDSTGAASGCRSVATLSRAGDTGEAARWVKLQDTWSGCGSTGQLGVSSRTWSCQDFATGNVVGGSSSTTGAAMYGSVGGGGTSLQITYSGSKTFYQPICGTGQKVVGARYAGGSLGPDGAAFGDAVPAGTVSQTTSVTCAMPDGTSTQISGNMVGQPDKIAVPSCQAAHPGSVPTHIGVTGGWPGAEHQQASVDLTNPASQYPDCFDSATGAYLNSCRVRVWINGQPCTNGMAGCYDPETYADDHPGTQYECKWGDYVVAWSDCAPLHHHYGTTSDTQTKTVDSVDPATGDPVTDPTTKTSSPPEACQVDCVAPKVPETPLDPNAPPRTPEDEGSCLGGVFSWNPINWVYVPVKCVLIWAFVPTPGYWDARVGDIRADLDGSSPGQYITAVTGLLPAFPDGAGCAGIPVDTGVGLTGHQVGVDIHLGAACSGDKLESAASIVKTVMTAVVYLGGAILCIRAVLRGFVYDLVISDEREQEIING